MTIATQTEGEAPDRRWLLLLVLACGLEGAALWLALTSSWYAPLLGHIAATGAAAEALRGWAPQQHRQSAARAAWAVGLAIPFAAIVFAGLIAWSARFDLGTAQPPSAEDERREAAQRVALTRARRRIVPHSVLALCDALESPNHETRIAAIEALRGRRTSAAIDTLVLARDNSLFEVRTLAAQLLEEVAAEHSRRLAAARQPCAADLCQPQQRMELIELLLEEARLPLYDADTGRALANEALTHARKLPRIADGGRQSELLLRCLLALGRPLDAEVAANQIPVNAVRSSSLKRVLAEVRFALRDIEGARLLLQPAHQPQTTNTA